MATRPLQWQYSRSDVAAGRVGPGPSIENHMNCLEVVWQRAQRFALVLIGAVAFSACNSGSETTTAPTQVKCQVALSAGSASIGATGGNATVNVTASPECPWDVSTGADWLADLSPRSGQGTATVEIHVAANPQPIARAADILVNDRRLNVSQAAGTACSFRLQPSALAIGGGGGSRDVTVSAGSDCAWTITSDASWLVTSASSGRGDGRIELRIAELPGNDVRVGTLALADQRLIVTQSPTAAECSYDVTVVAASPLAATGATATAAVTTSADCAWTASSAADWIAVASGGSGTGRGAVVFGVAPNAGAARSGSVVVAGRAFTLTQAAATATPCGFVIAPASASVAAAGGTGTVAVTAAASCGWTAASHDPWITVSSGATGSGSGAVSYSVAASAGAARTGTVSIAGQTFTVSQAAAATPCVYAVAPSSVPMTASGGAGSVAVTTGAACAWTATSNDGWLAVTAGASGSGNGPVTFTASANAGSARTGTLSVAGQTVTVTQAAAAVPCAYSLSETSVVMTAAGGPGSVSVSTTTGCGWTAASSVGWISVIGGASSSGSGPVNFSVAANTGGARTGTLTIAGQTFTVSQAAPVTCNYDISPRNTSIGVLGGTGSFTVTTTTGCAWTARSDDAWLVITAGASGSGAGSVQFLVAPNLGGARNGTIAAAGRTFTVRQDRFRNVQAVGVAPPPR